jgi:adenylate cyclase
VAEKFDGTLEDVFDLQDRVASSVAGAIVPALENVERIRAERKPTEHLNAYDYYMRAVALGHQWHKPQDETLRLLKKAIEIDPNFAEAYALATWCYCVKSWTSSSDVRKQEVAETERLARRAMELAKDDAFVLCWAGYSLARGVGKVEEGAALANRALELNPNLARAWNLSASARILLGEHEMAIVHAMKGMRLSPLDPAISDMHLAMSQAHFYLGRYDEALDWADRGLRERPEFPALLGFRAASLAMAGRLEAAQETMRRRIELEPSTASISALKQRWQLRRPEDVAHLSEAIRRAGMPE